MSRATRWFAVRQALSKKQVTTLTVLSFLLPILLWSLVSYVPFLWHPKVEIVEPGSIAWLKPGMLVDRADFTEQEQLATEQQAALPTGVRSNPIYLPAPHEVAMAFYFAFTTEPNAQQRAKWPHESLWHSIQIIFWDSRCRRCWVCLSACCAAPTSRSPNCTNHLSSSSAICPRRRSGRWLSRYWAYTMALKIAIIFIGTFFQQVLIIANTTRKLDVALLEAALTLGAKDRAAVSHVVIPGILPDLYRDQRILLGWAWTYLIVAELIGTSSGITWFITQQARYKNFDNVYAAIIMIGIIGVVSDPLLAAAGQALVPLGKRTGEGVTP